MEGVSRTLKNRERERKNTAIWKLVWILLLL
jgi:predicted nucleic acid-binding Zn ribbon protein